MKYVKSHCVVITCFDEHQPGYLDFLYRIRALAKVYQVTLVSQQALIQQELLVPRVQYYSIPHQGGKVGWLTYLVKSARYARSVNPDVVILLHSALAPITMLMGNIPSCLYWNEHPTNLMHMPSGFSPFKKSLTWVLQQLVFTGAKRATLVMPIGEDHQADLLARGVPADKIEMQYMGVADHFARASQQPRTDTTLKLVYTGTVSASRGRDVMLDAMHLVVSNNLYINLHLCMVGASESELAYCQQKIQKLGLQDHVEVVGRIPGDEVCQYLQNADAAICIWQPSQWNMFNPPTKLFEYLVAGLPVLASNIRTHARYVTHEKTGFIFDYHTQGLAEAIQTLYSQRERLPALKAHARSAGQQYVWSKLEGPFKASVKKVHSHAVI